MSKPDKQNSLLLRIPQDLDGQRLDKVLSHHPLIGSRSKATQLLDVGAIIGAKQKLKASSLVKCGEEYTILLPEPAKVELTAVNLNLEIVYEDEDLLVVNKPAGLVVHPAAGHAQDTLVNGLIYQVKDFSMGFGEARPGIVHRLDKDTCGLLVVAKNDFSQDGLVTQFKARQVSRLYRAIILGRPKRDADRIESYLLRHPVQRKKFASEKLQTDQAPRGKVAITEYALLANHFEELSLIECRLKTGRTHQIRVHLSELGHPIVGDPIYGSRTRENKIKSSELRAAVQGLTGIGLQAVELGFVHPRTKKNLFFKISWAENLLPLVKKVGWVDVE